MLKTENVSLGERLEFFIILSIAGGFFKKSL